MCKKEISPDLSMAAYYRTLACLVSSKDEGAMNPDLLTFFACIGCKITALCPCVYLARLHSGC